MKFDHRTFGFANSIEPEPSNYLRKDCGIRFCHPKYESNRICGSRRPPIPKLEKLKPDFDICKKNLIHKNIVRARTAPPRCSLSPRFCDTKNGDFHNLNQSGLSCNYIHQNKYGKIPNYLIARKKEFEKQNELVNEPKESQYYKISESERQELLNGLRYNYEVEQTEYRRLPLQIDQLPKLLRKAKLESNLKQIEHDIVLMESKSIYIQKGK